MYAQEATATNTGYLYQVLTCIDLDQWNRIRVRLSLKRRAPFHGYRDCLPGEMMGTAYELLALLILHDYGYDISRVC